MEFEGEKNQRQNIIWGSPILVGGMHMNETYIVKALHWTDHSSTILFCDQNTYIYIIVLLFFNPLHTRLLKTAIEVQLQKLKFRHVQSSFSIFVSVQIQIEKETESERVRKLQAKQVYKTWFGTFFFSLSLCHFSQHYFNDGCVTVVTLSSIIF